MKTQLKTLIAVAATGLMLAGAAANAQTGAQGGRYDRPDRHDRGYSQAHDADRSADRNWQLEKLRYDRAIVQQVNDLRAQIGHATRTRQINRREAAQYEGRLDRILEMKRRYARSEMGLDRREYTDVTSRLSDLSSDIDRNRPARYW